MQVNAEPDRERALRRLRPALGLDHLRGHQRVQGAAGTRCRSTRHDPRALSLLYFKNPAGRADPAGYAGASGHRDRARRRINHYGQLPAVTISFNLQPGASLGEVVRRIQEVAAANLPDTISTQFQGAAQAFQSSLGEPVAAADRRHHGGLHRAGHSVRELHPPAHDSLRPALGRLRRAADAVCCSTST